MYVPVPLQRWVIHWGDLVPLRLTGTWLSVSPTSKSWWLNSACSPLSSMSIFFMRSSCPNLSHKLATKWWNKWEILGWLQYCSTQAIASTEDTEGDRIHDHRSRLHLEKTSVLVPPVWNIVTSEQNWFDCPLDAKNSWGYQNEPVHPQENKLGVHIYPSSKVTANLLAQRQQGTIWGHSPKVGTRGMGEKMDMKAKKASPSNVVINCMHSSWAIQAAFMAGIHKRSDT